MQHTWIEGNSPVKCDRCHKSIKCYQGITGLHCVWCQVTVSGNGRGARGGWHLGVTPLTFPPSAPQQMCLPREAGVRRGPSAGPHPAAFLHLPGGSGACPPCPHTPRSLPCPHAPRPLPHPRSPPTRPRCVPQERQSHCRRSDSESPAGTSPEDGQSFKFNSTTVDGQGLQVGPPPPPGCGWPCCARYFSLHPFCLPDQPPAWDTSPAGVREPQEWREARRAVRVPLPGDSIPPWPHHHQLIRMPQPPDSGPCGISHFFSFPVGSSESFITCSTHGRCTTWTAVVPLLGTEVLRTLASPYSPSRCPSISCLNHFPLSALSRLSFFRDTPDFRVLACGGDGTVGWILDCIGERALWPLSTTKPLGRGRTSRGARSKPHQGAVHPSRLQPLFPLVLQTRPTC